MYMKAGQGAKQAKRKAHSTERKRYGTLPPGPESKCSEVGA